MKQLHGISATILCAGILLAAACARQELPPATQAGTPVRVEAVETTAAAATLRAIGRVAPADEVRLAFKSGGVIRSILVEQGARVRRGQLLARLADDEIAATLAGARALADKAERDLERGRSLFADDVVTREQVEDLATAQAVARAGLRAAEFNARHARIEAPAVGVVLQRLAEPDEMVGAGQPVLVLGSTAGGWIVRVAVSDRDIVQIRTGMVAEVKLDALPGQVFRAVVSEIAAASDPATGTYGIELALTNGSPQLVQGLIAKVELAAAQADPVPVVPLTALLEADGAAATVFVVSRGDAVAHLVPVRIGRLLGERVEVVAGLAPGDRVVTEGAAWLHDGARVRVLDTK